MIASLRDLGTTIVLTTHYMEEAERLADRVAVIQAGRLVALDTPTNLVSTEGAQAVITFVLPDGVDAHDLPTIGVGAARSNGQQVDIRSADPTRDLNALTEWALARGIGLEGLTMARPTLEDVYLDLTAGPSRA
jgi:ABC-2 type transport system ATP-binding protein